METDYNFWADLLTTYRSNPDWLKFFWLFLPAAMLTLAGHGLARLAAARAARAAKTPSAPPLVFRSWSDEDGVLYFEQVEELPPPHLLALDRTSGGGAGGEGA